jgi:hypothetical protein
MTFVKIKSHSSLLDNLAIVFDRLRLWGLCWKVAWLPGFAPGNRGQPRERQGDRSDAFANHRPGPPTRPALPVRLLTHACATQPVGLLSSHPGPRARRQPPPNSPPRARRPLPQSAAARRWIPGRARLDSTAPPSAHWPTCLVYCACAPHAHPLAPCPAAAPGWPLPPWHPASSARTAAPDRLPHQCGPPELPNPCPPHLARSRVCSDRPGMHFT